jgi:hypothetical protein
MRTIIELISATSTSTGLSVSADYDPNWYPKGVKITDKQQFHSPWNSWGSRGRAARMLNQFRREPLRRTAVSTARVVACLLAM